MHHYFISIGCELVFIQFKLHSQTRLAEDVVIQNIEDRFLITNQDSEPICTLKHKMKF